MNSFTRSSKKYVQSVAINANFDFKWSSKDMDLSQFMANHFSSIPLAIFVTEGYLGVNENFIFSSSDVYWVYNIYRLKRIIATTSDNRIMSIPIDLNNKFHVVFPNDGSSSQPMTLRNIVDMWQKMLIGTQIILENNASVSFLVSNDLEEYEEHIKLGIMSIEDVYDELYLVVHSINKGLIYPQIMLIPLFAKIRVAVACGLRSGNIRDYEATLREINRCCGLLPYANSSNEAIMKIMQLPDNSRDYTYVEPIYYMRHDQQTRYQNSSKSFLKPHHVYDSECDTANDSQDLSLRNSAVANKSNSGCLKVKDNIDTPPELPARKKPMTDSGFKAKSSEIIMQSINTKYEHLESKIETPVIQHNEYSQYYSNLQNNKQPVADGTIPKSSTKVDVARLNENNNPTFNKLQPNTNRPTVQPTKSSPLIYHDSLAPSIAYRGNYPPTGMQQTVHKSPIVIENSSNQLNASCRRDFSKQPAPTNALDSGTVYREDRPNSTLMNELVKRISIKDSSDDYLPMQRVLLPSSTQGKQLTEMVTNETRNKKNQLTYSSLEEVPEDIAMLTCDQVKCFVGLLFPSHPEYADRLAMEEVDGTILKELGRDLLVSECGFSGIDAVKLERFVQEAWRPKTKRTTVTVHLGTV